MNVGVAIAFAADAATGHKIGTILNAIKNSGDIMLVLKKDTKEMTLDDAAMVAK